MYSKEHLKYLKSIKKHKIYAIFLFINSLTFYISDNITNESYLYYINRTQKNINPSSEEREERKEGV